MTLSIIIPVYNVEQYLQKCIDSILVDNQFAGQMICVNDGSTDGSLAILEHYAAKYPNVEIITQLNKGLSEARNTGLKVAKGEYVMFVDSDDWIFPGTLKKVVGRIQREDVLYFNAKKYYEDSQTFDKDCNIEELKNVDGQQYLAEIYRKPRNIPYVCVVCGIYNRAFLLKNNLWNEPGIYHEDNYFTPQVLLAAKNISSVNEYVYVYRIWNGGITGNVTEKHIEDLLFVARNLYTKHKVIGDVKDVFYEDICNLYINLINAAYSHHIAVHRLWNILDSRHMSRGAFSNHNRRISKLTYISPRIAYRYMQESLPSLMRRFVNRYL